MSETTKYETNTLGKKMELVDFFEGEEVGGKF